MNGSTHRRGKNAQKSLTLPRACVQALLIGIIAAALFLLLAAAVTYAQADPIRFATPAALAALYLSVFVTGIAAARASASPMIAGAVCGAVWLVLILLLALIAGGDGGCKFSAVGSLLAHTGIPLASILAAFIAKKRSKRPSSHHKKRRR